VLAILMCAVMLVFVPSARATNVVAYFASTNGIYAGDEVRILGVPVGKITAVNAERDRVRVEIRVDGGVKVPAGAKAVIVAPSLVSSRYVQLTPRYTGGPTLHDGSAIPESRTATPVEWDQIKDQLNDLAVALGPTGANKSGALSGLVTSAAGALEGQGAPINETVQNLARAARTLQSGSGDAFSTVRNLQLFVSTLAQSDQQIALFSARLDAVSGLLDGDKGSLRTAMTNLAVAVKKVERFVRANRAAIKTSLTGLTDVAGVVAKQQQALAQTLQVAPNALSNLIESVHERQNAVGVDLQGANIHSPGQLLCGAVGGVSDTTGAKAGQRCQSLVGGLLDQLAGNQKTTAYLEYLEKLLGIG
jgi:phospholipid/cholesterol/gamma-HCH transport system substrate-binding protein